MKTTVKNAVMSVLILLTTALSATAGEGVKGAELISAGRLNNQPVFQLNINNKQNGKYAVIIKDQFGEVLYREVLTGTNISRNFQLNTEELGTMNVSFEVIDLKKSSNTAVFNVKNNFRMITETEITKG